MNEAADAEQTRRLIALTTDAEQTRRLIDLTIVCDEGSCNDPNGLGECEGDCDFDDDPEETCAQGLACFSRGGYETVPGCTGNGSYGKDYW